MTNQLKRSVRRKTERAQPIPGIRYTGLTMPKFRSEKDEAAWWDSHPEVVEELLQRALKSGNVTRGALARALPTQSTTIRLFAEDVARAKAAALQRGLRYQTYLKMVIHEALLERDAAG